MSVEVAASDVAQVILQFCRENGLLRTFETLQEEAQVHLNTVENIGALEEDILSGQWDAVLRVLTGMHLPKSLVADLFEQILLELVELRELDAARSLLRTSLSFAHIRTNDPDRYVHLERGISTAAVDAAENLYTTVAIENSSITSAATTKQSRRAFLAKAMRDHVTTVAPSRLVSLLGQSLKFQHSQGLLPPGTKFDLFRNRVPTASIEPDAACTSRSAVIRFGLKSHAECAIFSPRDDYFVTGSSDGFVEVWDFMSGSLRKDLKYQADEDLMSHDGAVSCMAFSREGELLATGGVDKKVKVWRIRSGKVLRRFELLRAPTYVEFSRDASQVLVGAPDGVIRLLGMKSGKMLKEFHGHTAAVNGAMFVGDGSTMLSVSGDGTMRLWGVKSSQCIKVVRVPNVKEGSPLLRALVMPDDQEQFLVCARSPPMQILSLNGTVSKKMTTETETRKADFVDAAMSVRGSFLYGLGSDNVLRVFARENSKPEPTNEILLSEKGSLGMVHHPSRNVLAVFGTGGLATIFRP